MHDLDQPQFYDLEIFKEIQNNLSSFFVNSMKSFIFAYYFLAIFVPFVFMHFPSLIVVAGSPLNLCKLC